MFFPSCQGHTSWNQSVVAAVQTLFPQCLIRHQLNPSARQLRLNPNLLISFLFSPQSQPSPRKGFISAPNNLYFTCVPSPFFPHPLLSVGRWFGASDSILSASFCSSHTTDIISLLSMRHRPILHLTYGLRGENASPKRLKWYSSDQQASCCVCPPISLLLNW